MSKNNLGQFFNQVVYVKLKNDCNLKYFRDCSYCDYRVGCSICERGDAKGFETNLLDIIKDDYFLLNDLDIIVDYDPDHDCEPELPYYYETEDKDAITVVFDYFKQFNALDISSNPSKSLIDNTSHSCGITSIFREDVTDPRGFSYVSDDKFVDINKVRKIHICGNCFKWLVCLDHKLKDKFHQINALQVFWYDLIEEDLKDIIEFKNPDDKKLFISVDD
jgi:hypothetical protein